MNVTLRTAHAGAFLTLGVVLLPLLALSLHARPERGRVDTSAIAGDPRDEKDDPATKNREIITGISLRHGATGFSLRTTAALREPDVLVYADSDASLGPRLKKSARLLGSAIPGRDLELVTRPGEGTILLYSLGHQKILAATPLAIDGVEGLPR